MAGRAAGSGVALVAARGRPGTAASATMAPARPTAAPMARPRSIPLRNAVRAAWASTAPVRAAHPRRDAEGPPTDPRMVLSTACGRWWGASRLVIRPVYRVARTLPITATPSAPPTCMKVPLVAEPTPVSPGGSDPMTKAVVQGMVSPAPTPSMIIPATLSP